MFALSYRNSTARVYRLFDTCIIPWSTAWSVGGGLTAFAGVSSAGSGQRLGLAGSPLALRLFG